MCLKAEEAIRKAGIKTIFTLYRITIDCKNLNKISLGKPKKPGTTNVAWSKTATRACSVPCG